MQHSRPPNFPLVFPSFKQHRSSLDQSRFAVHLTLPKPSAVPVWATLPSPPMSESPPPQPSSDPSQIAGRRRKRSETPPPTTAPARASFPAHFEYSPVSTTAHSRGGPLAGDVLAQTIPYSSSLPLPVSTYGSGAPMGVIVASPTDPVYAAGQVSPKAVRKTKAHVASACVNCKRKHLRCDSARPCRRCVQSGKEVSPICVSALPRLTKSQDTCKDTEHKKRGRPPLRPDESSSRRSYDQGSGVHPGLAADSSRRPSATDPSLYGSTASYSRTFRPLQAQPTFDATRSQFRPSQSYQMYATPSIQPSSATAMGSFVPSSRQYGSAQPLSGIQAPPSYVLSSSDPSRGMSLYPGGYSYPAPQEQIGAQPPQMFSNPIFPRAQLPVPQGEGGSSMMGSASLQLPPIRATTERSPIDPALVQPRRTSQEIYPREQGSGNGTTRQPDPKRPKMDIQRILEPRDD